MAGLENTTNGTKGTILLVDDETLVRELVGELLTDAGYTVIEAEDGQKGLEAYRRQPVNLVVSDVIMPKMDGVEMYRAIKGINPNARAVFISGNPGQQRDNLMRLVEAREAVFIQKPIGDFPALVATVNKMYKGQQNL